MKIPRKDKKEIDKKVNKSSLSLLRKNIGFWFGKNAQLKIDIILKSIIFCAMRRLYFESGLEEFAIRAKQWIPDADTINSRIKRKTKEEILTEFMKTQNELFSKLRKMRLFTRRVIAMIDITEIPYWGNKNDTGVVGTKKQKGTSYCYQYITINILIKGFKVCLHALPVTSFSNKAKLVDELLKVALQKVRIGLVLMDRGFANSKIIPVIEKYNLRYLAPITKNDKIYGIIKDLYWNKRNFDCDKIINYTFGNGVTTKLFFTLNKKKKHPSKLSEKYFSWCTNIVDVNTKNREDISEIYGRRWNIENFYRDGKGNFLIRTKTKIFKVRLFFFLLTTMLYNLWQLTKLILQEDVTAQKWKCSVYELLYSKTNISYILTYEEKIWNDIMLS